METETPKPKKSRPTQADRLQEELSIMTKVLDDNYRSVIDYKDKEIKVWKYSYFVILVIFLFFFLIQIFFYHAPVNRPTRGQSELTTWTKHQAQKLPANYRLEIKTIFREAYQEAATDIQSQKIVTTTDARLRLSQLIQAKILSLNRLSNNPKELETIIEAMNPLSEAIGERLESDVKSGKMQDDLEYVQKAFKEISEGLK
jgi:hypothetical protein